jgi:hypothetical protein
MLLHIAHHRSRGASPETFADGARCGVPGRGPYPRPGRFGTRARRSGGDSADASRGPGPKTARVGAPRGPFRFAPDGRVSQTWCAPLRRARRMRIPPPGAPPAPSIGGGGDRCKAKENPGAATRGGNEETALFDIVNRQRRDRLVGATRRERPAFRSRSMRAASCGRVNGNALGPGRGRACARRLGRGARRDGSAPPNPPAL